MPRLRRIPALCCCWCLFLALGPALADEEAARGPTPTAEKPPEEKPGFYGWTLSFPSLPFNVPFFSSSSESSEGGGPIHRSEEDSASGEGSVSEASEPPAAATARELLTSVTQIRAESLPTGTSDSPQGRAAPGDNDSLVSDSYSPTSGVITNSVFAHGPVATSAPEQNATHSIPRRGEENTFWTISPETTVPTALTSAVAPTSTSDPGLTGRPPGRTFTGRGATEAAVVTTPQSTVDMNVFPTPGVSVEAGSGPAEERGRRSTTATWVDGGPTSKSITGATRGVKVNVPTTREPPPTEDRAEETEETPAPSEAADAAEPLTTSPPQSTGFTPGAAPSPPDTEDWMSDPEGRAVTLLPDCNKERSGVCDLSDAWGAAAPSEAKAAHNASGSNQSVSPFLVPAPLMLVPLYTDWNGAMASWGPAWDAHIYGAGGVFAVLTLASALNLLCLPLRCPSGCGYFALVSLFLLAAGGTRSFALLYDAYGHQDRLPSAEASLMLYETPFPCLTAAFGSVFLLLSMRSRMQLSYSAFQRPCFLACLVVLHFAAAFCPATLLKFYRQQPPLCLLLLLVSRGAFAALAAFLSAAYFVFYVYVRADSKHIYHLNNTSPTPAERYNRCPFAESRDWERAAATVCLSALFLLASAGLQLYAMLNAMGVAGGEEVLHPWPWWAFHFSCRLCELGVCLTLALVVAQPVYCSDRLPAGGGCWTELLASKSPILPGSYQWTLSHQEKLAIVDTVGLGETESLPLYAMMDERLASSLNGLDLLYHSNRALAYRDLDPDLESRRSGKPEDGGGGGGGGEPSGGSSFTSDSTADLRPPSPINLRRSIDEALFSEALFPMSLFSHARPGRCSDPSVDDHCALPGDGFCDPLAADPGLYRTSSCIEVAPEPQTSRAKSRGDAPPSPCSSASTSCSSPERWRGSSSSCSLCQASVGGSSLVLCPSPEANPARGRPGSPGLPGSSDPQGSYRTLGAASQESLDLDASSEADRSVQEEFISVCRQIDSRSVCSETIDL